MMPQKLLNEDNNLLSRALQLTNKIKGTILPPCNYYKFTVLQLQDTFAYKCTTTIELDSKVTVVEQHETYTLLNFFAEVGGYLGIFTGLSLFNLSALFK